VYIDARYVVLHQDMHGRCDLRGFGEVDLVSKMELPRGSKIKMY
jgi:hypothetical protein